jgi:indole-3-glycerol phosphate synthase
LPEAQAPIVNRVLTGPLGELTAASRLRAREAEATRASLEAQLPTAPRPLPFADSLRGLHVRVIAELKRRSPSKGVINDGIRAEVRAKEYESGGAAALSVLTEPTRFGGSLDDLRAVRDAVGVPLLRKDFITAPIQLLEARVSGASAVLLIARALSRTEVLELAAAAIEVRSEAELATALDVPRAVVGVNNRNLESLLIDDAIGARLLPMIPRDRVAVYESGIATTEDVRRAAAMGADAVLVGSVLSVAPDPVQAVRDLTTVGRRGRP